MNISLSIKTLALLTFVAATTAAIVQYQPAATVEMAMAYPLQQH